MSQPPPLLNLTTHQLQYLLAVDRWPTMADAARELRISPSALSQGLSELERKLGLTLFERRGRNRALTAQGREALARCERILAATRDLTVWANAAAEGERGEVRLGLIDIAAVHYFPDTLVEFRTERPDVDLRLTVAPSATLVDQLLDGRLDAAVIVEPPSVGGQAPLGPTGAGDADRDGLTTRELLTEELAIYAPVGPPGTGQRIDSPATWGPWVTFPPPSHTRRHIAAALRRLGNDFRVEAESHQPDGLRQLVHLGLGWTVLPVLQAEAEPTPLLRARRRPLLTRRLVVAQRRGSPTDPATDRLVAGLVAGARRFAPGGASETG